jgi:NAD(P)-dependent dehydrogenase (short-subunit alcohol dehydrogenase family)
MDMTGRVALVTGAAGHIGSVMAETLAELGAAIVIVDLDEGACASVAGALRDRFGVRALPCAANLRDDAAVQRIAGRVHAELGRLDVVINAAAMVGTAKLDGWVSAFEQQRLDVWRDAVDINLTAPFALVQSCADLLRASGRGSVINVASIYGMLGPDWRLYEDTPLGNPAAYAASKGGLLQLTRWLATTLAPAVRVNAITPGGVYRDTPDPFLSRYVARVPLGRMAIEQDFKGAVAYLASDLSAYVTGHNLVVDGGWTAW